MTREQAIKVVKYSYLNDKDLLKEALEVLIPEIKESKDENIIKFISHELACVRAIDEKDSDRYKELTDAIAWLERQGEHANFRNKIQIGDEVTRNEDGILVNLSQFERVVKKKVKQGEQKEIDYDDELKKCRENPLYFFDKYVKIKIKDNKLAWSEEDEKMWYSAIEYVRTYPAHRNSVVDWLKSIKERMKGE